MAKLLTVSRQKPSLHRDPQLISLYVFSICFNFSLPGKCLEANEKNVTKSGDSREERDTGQLLTRLGIFFTGSQPKAGTGHEMQRVSVVFSTLHC